MEFVEVNSEGNFDTWEPAKIEELNSDNLTTHLGQKLLYEDNNIRVWQIKLFPLQRFPFRKVNTNYSLIAMNKGIAISRCATGKITLLRLQRGDTNYYNLEGSKSISDLENIGETVLFMHMLEHKPILNEID